MIETILFDLDGTIIDTNELIISAFINVLSDHVPQPFTREQIIPVMGIPLEEQLRIFTGKEDVTEFVKAYREYNAKHHDDMVKLFPNVKEVIAKLYEQGFTLGVVTTKMRSSTSRIMEMFDLGKYMSVLVTVDDVEHPKPHPEPVQKAVQQLGVNPATALMIGDSPIDIQSAQAAGTKSAGVAWSLKGEEVLKKYNPDYILHNMTDLYHIS
ncbi:pyrophosphatase PpaX [Paenibacillus sediminis]|uniref:Pyrophosphatase PpaX n=1 Tax=Paenibacillus sediminis TaxID=664909 RepID=A0ABS4H3I8_9BACL|nr:pyrophosphatase PpaX [Paenibacillus sediminis]MBP1937095.1 pyrophosphatase PpaX [Paenibacillus sediminis]